MPRPLRYEGNRKHKEPWQPGRRGSLCPQDVTVPQAQVLLEQSLEHDQQRFACREGRAYRAQSHASGVWHAHPIGWREVPAAIRKKLAELFKVKDADNHRFWSDHG